MISGHLEHVFAGVMHWLVPGEALTAGRDERDWWIHSEARPRLRRLGKDSPFCLKKRPFPGTADSVG